MNTDTYIYHRDPGDETAEADRVLILMQGIPGSGKSTVAEVIGRGWNTFSTDKFWYQDDPAVYNYNPQLAGVAHKWNQDRVRKAMERGWEQIIVDNTNITRKDTKPYFDMAREHGYTIQVVRVEVPVEVAIQRQKNRPVDRRVPEEVIRKMHSRMEDLL